MSEVDAIPSTSNGAKEGSEIDTQEALDMLALGKRNMLCNEVPQAVNQLQQACTMLAKKYGETADECGDAYFSYGKALLHLARMESDVLGNALQGISEEEDGKSEESGEGGTEEEMSEGEKEELSDKIIEAMEERDEEGEKEKEGEKPEETGEGSEEKKETEDGDKGKKTGDSDVEMGDVEMGDDTGKGEDGAAEGAKTEEAGVEMKEDSAETKENSAAAPKETKESAVETKDAAAESKDATAKTDEATTAANDSTAQSKDVAGETKDEAGETKDEAAETKDVAAETKELPAETKDVPAETKDVPAETKDVPAETKDEAEMKDMAETEGKKDNQAEAMDADMAEPSTETKADSAEKKETTDDKTKAETTDSVAKAETKDTKTNGEVSEKENAPKDKEEKAVTDEMETETNGKTTEGSAMESEDLEEEGDEDGEEGEGGSADDEDKDEDVTNLQLAWEMLELSKIIYKRHTKKEDQIKLAETHLRLGEVGLETGNYDQALGDLKECLNIQKSVLEPEHRDIAETSYQLGLAYTCISEYDSAVQSYKDAASCIEAKIEKLKKLTEGAKAEDGKEADNEDAEITSAKKEIAELEGILPDIAGKMQDVLDEQQTAEKVKECVKENLIGEAASAGETTTGFGDRDKTTETKPVSDISHLVRKKRKPEAEEEQDETKKARTEPNGDCTNGHVNGEGDGPTTTEMEQTASTS